MKTFPIAVARGDGIGPEIMAAVLQIFEAADVPLEFRFVEMGRSIYERGVSTGITDDAKRIVEETGILFKGPMETPRGSGVKSINVTARKIWNAFANVRVFRTLRGVDTVFSRANIPIDITIVRENIEDTYGGIEHLLTHDVALCRRIITRPGSLQVHRYAFEMARAHKARRLTCAHKANIMKMTDGLFLECFYEVAKDFPEISVDDIIIDDLAMKLVTRPDRFHFIVLPNLQGDVISDLCAGLVGGLGFAPSANIGESISIFEAVHGTAPDIAGKHIANPTSLLLSGVMLLRHLGWTNHAEGIEQALFQTLEEGLHTADFGDTKSPALGTMDFANAIIKHLPKQKLSSQIPGSLRKATPEHVRMMSTPTSTQKEIVGFDMFFEATTTPAELGKQLLDACPSGFHLKTITNRGTQVWPVGSVYTECVNQFQARFETENHSPVDAETIFEILQTLSARFSVCSMELLNRFGQKDGFSLAQGQ